MISHFTTHINSNCYSISVISIRHLCDQGGKGQGRVKRLEVAPTGTTTYQYLSIHSFALSATVWPEFHCQIMLPKFNHHLGVRWTQWTANVTNQNVNPTFLFYFYSHHKPSLHRLATIYNTSNRGLTDRVIEIGRLALAAWKSASIHPLHIRVLGMRLKLPTVQHCIILGKTP